MLFQCIFIFTAFFPCLLLAQPDFIASLYPPQHGLNIPADTALAVGLQAPLDPASLSDSAIYVWSDITGLHRLQVTLEDGDQTVRIAPRHWHPDDRLSFNAGERVTVTLTTRLRYADGRPFEGFTWHYTVAVRQGRGGTFTGLAVFGGYLSTYFNVSDFNADGWADLVGNDSGADQNMVVYFNQYHGTLVFSHITDVGRPYAEVADLDRDGDQDIAYAGDHLIFNDGYGNFHLEMFPERPAGFAKAHDFNNDGILDFAIGSATNDTVFFGLSEKGNAFAKQYYSLPQIRPEFYYAGISYDLNNDGRIDLLHNGRTGKVYGFVRYLEIGSSDSPTPLYYDAQFQIFNFYGNDFDADGNIDYIMVGGGSGSNIQYMNDGAGALLPEGLQTEHPAAQRLRETVTGGDFDGDGDIDLAFANSNLVSVLPVIYEPDVCFYSNDGKGNFTLTDRVPLPFNRVLSRKLDAVDLDNDGDLDLIGVANGVFYVVANDDYAVSVREQQQPSPPSDFRIEPVFPNPAKDRAIIRVQLSQTLNDMVTVAIFDITGRLVHQRHHTGQEKTAQFTWDARDQGSNRLPNGVYFVQARMGGFRVVQKFLLMR